MGLSDEAMLSEAERAALAGLESKAEADDPHLAAHLRGARRIRPAFKTPGLLIRASRTWTGPVLAILGLIVTVLTLSVSVLPALVGAAIFVAGLIMSSALVKEMMEANGHRSPDGSLPDPGSGRRPGSDT